MSENTRSFRELRVWQKAMDLAMDVFKATRRFPTHERFSLVDQIRRSSSSVASNVAAAWKTGIVPSLPRDGTPRKMGSVPILVELRRSKV